MKLNSFTQRPKLFWVLLFQFIFYFFIFVLPLRNLRTLFPNSDPAIQLYITIPIICIIGILCIIFADRIRYWVVGIPVLYGFAMLYSNRQAILYLPSLGGGYISIFDASSQVFMLSIAVFLAQSTVCVIVRIIKYLINHIKRKGNG